MQRFNGITRLAALLICVILLFSASACSVTPQVQAHLDAPTLENQNMQIGSNNVNYNNPLQQNESGALASGLFNVDDKLIKDTDGSFTVPFDLAYPDAFEAGAFNYDPTVLLLKMEKDFDGKMTAELSACGFESIEEFCVVTDGVWYRANLAEDAVITEVAASAREVEYIKIVDYDYIAEKASTGEIEILNDSVKDNPRINEQWYLDSCNIQEAWAHLASEGLNPGGSSSVIVAVIDTGVDYNHPDLTSNMWVNSDEIPGNKIDDDGNGYIDDIHGCSTIGSSYNHSGDPMDDHGHGTHVAGIIGAANNNTGIVGIAHGISIMAIKAGQASGVFNQSDIAEAILYAYENGAEVINMSFGGAGCSLAVQEALELAWTRATLVAAAGNSGRPNRDTFYYAALPNYPANLFYVIGVMSTNQSGIEAPFSNWDANTNGYNIYAPGENILSTLPNGSYGYLSGTSMASPVVAAMAALLRSKYSDRNIYPSKFITAQICSTGKMNASCVDPEHHRLKSADGSIGPVHDLCQIVDVFSALTNLPNPKFSLSQYYIFDDMSLSGKNNGDGVVNSGETINIGAVLYNRWGMSKDTVVTIDAIESNGVANPYVEIINSSSNFEGVGTYSTKDQLIRDGDGVIIGVEEPLTVRISDNCPNDYTIVLNVIIQSKNALNENDHTTYWHNASISFSVANGVILPLEFTEDTTLTNDKYYILTNTCYIPKGVTLTIERGTQIQFWTNEIDGVLMQNQMPRFLVSGSLITKGTEDAPVILFTNELRNAVIIQKHNGISDEISLSYTEINNPVVFADKVSHCSLQTTVGYSTQLYYRRQLSDINLSTIRSVVSVDDIIEYSLIDNCYSVGARTISHSSLSNCNKVGLNMDAYLALLNNQSPKYYNVCELIESSSLSNITDPFAMKFLTCISINCDTLILGENCVNINHEKDLWAPITKVEALSNTPYVVNCVENENKTTKYFIIYLNDSDRIWSWTYDNNLSYQNSIHYDSADYELIANLLGGSLACLETEEEYSLLLNNRFYGACGLRPNTNIWMNGTTTGSWLQPLVVYPDNGKTLRNFANLDNGKLSFVPNYYDNQDNIIIEFSKDECSFYDSLNIDSLNEMIKEISLSGKFGMNNQNLVIIPDFTTSDINYYCQLTIQEGIFGFNGTYWGTTNRDLIELMVLDSKDAPGQYGTAIIDDFLTEAPSSAYPFVVDAYVLNQNGERVRTVNNETVTFVVEFNRDMDQSVPLKVTFGSSAETFYEDYNISEYGTWVTPRRWEATYTLKTIIENGNHTIKIENGCAADDEWLKLYDVPGRFMFEIDTTAAQALIMQGHATETGIQLSWMQDDFDILMGYNVYRSDREDGYYQRLNSSVIPYDQKGFFDDTVEPGKIYYYNFTVVKTDLTESEPSGKISLMSMDTMAPNIYHSPVYTAYTGSNLIIGATVTDNLGLRDVKLYYRTVGSSEWKSATMSVLNSRYTGLIPAEQITLAGIEYYIVAYDGINYTYKGSKDSPYVVAVQAAVDSSSLGDVDGDGIITNKDALMLLQAANDLLNLTEEQFMRADINGDKELSAAEALRILQYISGKVTTIVG